MTASNQGMKITDKSPANGCIQTQSEPFAPIDCPTNNHRNNRREWTYSLLMRSEDKRRTALEAVIYVFLICGPLIAILQFAEYRVAIPVGGLF